MGAILGGVNGHILGAQIGAISRVLLHKAVTSPFTHVQTQLAFAKVPTEINRNERQNQITKNVFLTEAPIFKLLKIYLSLQSPS